MERCPRCENISLVTECYDLNEDITGVGDIDIHNYITTYCTKCDLIIRVVRDGIDITDNSNFI